MLLKTLIVGDLIKKIYLARFANTICLLESIGTPLLRCIALVRQMINYHLIKTSLLKIEEDLLQDESFCKSLLVFPFYLAKMMQLIKVGEEGKQNGYFSEKIAAQYTEQIEYHAICSNRSLLSF